MIRHITIGNGVEVACAIDGEGPPLLLLHGAESDRTKYAALTSPLAPQFT